MREVAATGDLTRKIALRQQPLGRRGRAAAGDDVQHADRLDRAVPARDVAEGAAVVARPAVDGDRARGPQSADDHQGVAARAAPARRQRRLRCARRSPTSTRRSRGSTASSTRCSISRGRSASSSAPADLNALCRESAAAAEAAGAGAPVTLALDAAAPHGHDRRRAAAHRARQHARQRAPRGERRWSARRRRSPVAGIATRSTLATRVVRSSRDDYRRRPRRRASTPADLPHVFDPYFTTKRGGTGLGLPIAKNIVEGLGGTIGVTSAPGRGHRDPHRPASRQHQQAD